MRTFPVGKAEVIFGLKIKHDIEINSTRGKIHLRHSLFSFPVNLFRATADQRPCHGDATARGAGEGVGTRSCTSDRAKIKQVNWPRRQTTRST